MDYPTSPTPHPRKFNPSLNNSNTSHNKAPHSSPNDQSHIHHTSQKTKTPPPPHHGGAPPPPPPRIPDDVAILCLSRVPASTLFSVCRSWRRLIYTPTFTPFLSLYTLCSPTTHLSNTINLFTFDPSSSKWLPLPPPPPWPPLNFLLRHPSFISRKLPIQSAAASENLLLLAATDENFLPALPQPLIFNALAGEWSHAPPLTEARRWCAAGAVSGSVYVASGIGSHYKNDVACCLEKLDIETTSSKWEKMKKLKNGKFSRDAIEAIGWRGKLCMVNVKGEGAKEGLIYDVATDTWAEMPEEMVAGWKGPAAAMEEESIYVVDEKKGVLKMYDHVRDTWVVVVEDERLKGAEKVAARGGRVGVLGGDGAAITVVDVAAEVGRVWVVEAPVGFEVVGVHILPRLSQLNF